MGTYIDNIALCLGDSRPVEELSEEGVDDPTASAIRNGGLRYFIEDQRSLAQMAVEAIRATLQRSKFQPSDIDTIFFGSASSNWSTDIDSELMAGLEPFGFRQVSLKILIGQTCSACCAAIELASAAIAQGASNNAVIVVGEKYRDARSRVYPGIVMVASDGAAACTVSSRASRFEVLSTCSFNTQISGFHSGAESSRTVDQAAVRIKRIVQSVFQQTLAPAGIDIHQVSKIICQNVNLVGHILFAAAAGVNIDLIYGDDLSRYAHVNACDNLIGLSNYSSRNPIQSGGYILLLEGGLYSFSAALLQCTDSK